MGDPPRQTEDPDSPPCVAFFDGDNFGATYQGVTGDEITYLLYFDDACYESECVPLELVDTLVDLDQSPRPACPKTAPDRPSDCDPLPLRVARALGAHSDGRYQSYDRRLHAYAYITSADTEAERRLDAAAIWQQLRPFAALDQAILRGGNAAFVSGLAARGVMVFSTPRPLSAAAHTTHAPLLWDFQPDLRHRAELYSDYVCEKLVGSPVAHAGAQGAGPPNGEERGFGIFHTDESASSQMGALVADRVGACLGLDDDGDGGILEGVKQLVESILGGDEPPEDDETGDVLRYGSAAAMKADGVTTVLWTGGVDHSFTPDAAVLAYHPEIVVLGDEQIDTNAFGRAQDQAVWANAWGVQFPRRIDTFTSSFASRAYADGSGIEPSPDEARWALGTYRDHFLFATAVQLAGPRLNPRTVDQGLRAIPEESSSSPYDTAFFFQADNSTGLKDAMEVWWDPLGSAPNTSASGCMRMVDDGARRRIGDWSGDTDAFDDPTDPCSGREAPAVS